MGQQRHYAILTGYRDSTQSRVQRFVVFTGRKLEGLAQMINDFDEMMGSSWQVHGEIPSREYFEMRLQIIKREEAKWNERLR